MLLIPLLAQAQGFAGPDRSICTEGTTKLGGISTCTDCCYLWSPETGLDDPSKPNPTVSGLTKTQNYTVYISYPDGHYESDDVNVTVYDSDVQIFHPNYFKINTLIPENEEKVPGAQSYVNLDNDDCDKDFDIDDIIIEGGDNEFIKMRVMMTILQYNKPGSGGSNPDNGPSEYEAALDLAQGTAVSGLRFWKSNDKAAGEYFIGNPLVLTAVNGFPNMYETYIWAEGTEAHTIQQQVKLFTRAYDDLEPACTDKFVGITIVGIEKIEWVGKENGYTGDGKNNSNTLDEVNGSVRVFPENKGVDPGTTPKKSVTLKVTFTVLPPVGQQFHLRSFDLDDPSTEIIFIDPNDGGSDGLSGAYTGTPKDAPPIVYTADEDNRGLGGSTGAAYKAGYFSSSSSSFSLVSPSESIYKFLSVTDKVVELDFWVSQYCGDNYKVAVSNDFDFLQNTRNWDKFDGGRIVDRCNIKVSKYCDEIDPSLYSKPLTVWRTLHIEYDGMKAPDSGLNENLEIRDAYMYDFVKLDGKIADILICDANGAPYNYKSDGSLEPKGRFNRGRLENIGNLITPPTSKINKIRPQTLGSINIVVEMMTGSTELPNVTGLSCKIISGVVVYEKTIKDIEDDGVNFLVTLETPLSNLSSLAGAMVELGGGSFQSILITAGASTTSFRIEKIRIPLLIKDDDVLTRLPATGIDYYNGVTKSAYSQVYIDAVFDGGVSATYNETDLDFLMNVPKIKSLDPNATSLFVDNSFGNGSSLNTGEFENDNYWIARIVFGWQAFTSNDDDPREEPAGRAMTPFQNENHCSIGGGADFSMIFVETCLDHGLSTYNSEALNQIAIQRTIAHEIGHQLGLTHGFINKIVDCASCIEDCNKVGLMNYEITSTGPVASSGISSSFLAFIELHQHLIRIRVSSPQK
jgi:hypothetical protein